jgi:hypothetical protein
MQVKRGDLDPSIEDDLSSGAKEDEVEWTDHRTDC